MLTLTPSEIDNLVARAVSAYLADRKDPVRRILGIPRGGMAVAYRVAHEFERRHPEWPAIVTFRTPEKADGFSLPPGQVLVVDDIADSGETIKPWHGQGCATMVLLAYENTEPFVDYCGDLLPAQPRHYINFPWDEASNSPADAVVRILEFLGVDPTTPSLKKTPERFLSWLAEFKADQEPPEITTFEGVTYDQMVLVRGIDFMSLCEHHLLPFFGSAAVAYIPEPAAGVIGLSKLARIVQHRAKRPQVQERLTDEILQAVITATGSQHVAVLLKAEHSCMAWRGPKVPGHSTVTSALAGDFREDARTRQEFLNLAGV